MAGDNRICTCYCLYAKCATYLANVAGEIEYVLANVNMLCVPHNWHMRLVTIEWLLAIVYVYMSCLSHNWHMWLVTVEYVLATEYMLWLSHTWHLTWDIGKRLPFVLKWRITSWWNLLDMQLANGGQLLGENNWASAWDFQQCGMWDQQSLRSACAYAQSDQSLC